MPFITEYNHSKIVSNIIEIPEDIWQWSPYERKIYNLNKLHKSKLFFFFEFCKNKDKFSLTRYSQLRPKIDNYQYVFESTIKPSYHLYQTCDRLNSDFINYKIPKEIKDRKEEIIEEYRKWFKADIELFATRPDIYQARLLAKFSIASPMEALSYTNSGSRYIENNTVEILEARINSLIRAEQKYYTENKIMKGYRTSSYKYKDVGLDNSLKILLVEYENLFIFPLIEYIKEWYKLKNNVDESLNVDLLSHLGFRPCGVCHSPDYKENQFDIDEINKELIIRFGNHEFPLDFGEIHFKKEDEITTSFFYGKIYRNISKELMYEDKIGKYQIYGIEFIDKNNHIQYSTTRIYEEDAKGIELFRYYLTKIEITGNNQVVWITYNYSRP